MHDDAPFRNFNFRVEIDRIATTGFSEAVIPESRIEVIEVSVPGLTWPLKVARRATTGNVVLRRGIDGDFELWEWFRAARDGRPDPRNGSIVLLDSSHADACRWSFFRAWPVAFAFGPLRGEGREVVIETLELAVERIEVAGVADLE